MIEAELQTEGIKTVSFYQFRHLKFQEYLAAVATVERHYARYAKMDDIVVPLRDYLQAEEWKEVIPMAAVLAKKQAEPLLTVINGMIDREFEQLLKELGTRKDDAHFRSPLPRSIDLLLQCLFEEAEASPETLHRSIEHLVSYAKGCREHSNWEVLIRGPYGSDFIEQAWTSFIKGQLPKELWIRNTFAVAAFCRMESDIADAENSTLSVIENSLKNDESIEVRRTLLAIAGSLWGTLGSSRWSQSDRKRLLELVEPNLEHPDDGVFQAAIWAWGLLFDLNEDGALTIEKLNLFKEFFFREADAGLANFVLNQIIGIPKTHWKPHLSVEEVARLKNLLEDQKNRSQISPEGRGAIVLAHYHGGVVSKARMSKLVERLPPQRSGMKRIAKEDRSPRSEMTRRPSKRKVT